MLPHLFEFCCSDLWLRLFQSTLPARGATFLCCFVAPVQSLFQSTLPVRGATLVYGLIKHTLTEFQSTRPVRGATPTRSGARASRHISIHAPREGSDVVISSQVRPRRVFQSTLPARGATSPMPRSPASSSDFNPRSPRGERPVARRGNQRHDHFNPRSPRGERLRPSRPAPWCRTISIHAPREGSDAHVSIHR